MTERYADSSWWRDLWKGFGSIGEWWRALSKWEGRLWRVFLWGWVVLFLGVVFDVYALKVFAVLIIGVPVAIAAGSGDGM